MAEPRIEPTWRSAPKSPLTRGSSALEISMVTDPQTWHV
jgi:hypothetical protein